MPAVANQDFYRIVTCEHGGNKIPSAYARRFNGFDDLLRSHRGFDPGALALWNALVARGTDWSSASVTSRLLIDLNRSESNPRVFSVVTRAWSAEDKEDLIVRFHRPYWEPVAATVRRALQGRRTVLHISVHTFTPVLGRSRRDFDVGILYDSSHHEEREWCRAWAARIRQTSGLRVRLNRPYLGKSDGLTTALRNRFGPRYLGVELEVNQALWEESTWATGVLEGIVSTV